ncbi:MAG TPA: hypothetical protein VMB47_02260 [Candidatus Aquilonibacter sp.]|nr:hypothetical protein [Candidatus Aquilonibacter sp.]
MKFLGFLLAGILLAGSSASAQTASPSLLAPTTAAFSLTSTSASAPEPYALPAAPVPAPKPQRGVIGVYEQYDFQVYVGYTFLRFYMAPHQIQSRNGFDSSISYFYNAGWFGADGELLGAFGSQGPYTSRFAFAGAGPRFRWSAPRGLELWAHGLVGVSHYVPQTSYGSQQAFAYETGIGIDATGHRQRLAYRLELDMIGSHYFSTYQLSPKASVGIVWKF